MPYVIIGGLVIASTFLAGTAWIVLQRRQPYLTEDALLSDASNSTNHLLVLRRSTEADRAALKQVFAKSPDFVWIHNNGNPLSENDEAPLAEQVSYMMEFVFQIAESYGHIIKSVDKDGNYQGSTCLIPAVSPSLCNAYEIKAIVTGVGKPPSIIWDHPERKARFESFE
jgi:hypothetical protein